jgi:hypothetical protein
MFAWREELRALAVAANEAGVTPAADETLAFNLESKDPDEARKLEASLAAEFTEAVRVGPLFDNPDLELGRFTRLEFAAVDTDVGAPIAYDVAYALADTYALRSAEPDLPSHFYFEPGEDPERGDDAESALVSAFCEVSGTPPPDQRWAVKMVRAAEAAQYSLDQGRPSAGAGVRIAQPDTGVVVPNLDLEAGSLDANLGWDIILNKQGAVDPLNYSGNKGHGTATSSVVISRTGGQVTGSAPAAQLYPIRTIKSVVVFKAAPVARAIEKATTIEAQVITMSLGGVPSRAVRAALRKAVASGVIVVAAAGNCVRLVVWPARYPECIAVGGCNVVEKPWKGSCRGGAVDITAPAEQVWHASATDPRGFNDGQGTSFAVALVAGAAAQWLAHHGPAAVATEARNRNVTVQALFREAIQQTARASQHLDPDKFGPGIINIEALLRKSLSEIRAVSMPLERPGDDPGDATPPEYLEILRAFAPDAEAAQIDWRRYGAEVGEVALRRAVSARAEGVDLPESAPAPVATDLRAAAAASGNQALQGLLGQ